MIRRHIASIILVLISRVTCQDYYGDDSEEPNSIDISNTFYDASMEWPLNLDGSLRKRMALNGALSDPGKSFVCSPVSALLPLGKLALGASGDCELQLMGAIGVDSTSAVKSRFRSLLHDLKRLSGVKLTLCSRIYIDKNSMLQPKFELAAKSVFKSSIKRINVNQPAKVASKINNWVKHKTKNMITEIVQPDDISPSASLIMVNAVYFSGAWKSRFTRVEWQDFYTAVATRKVEMMTRHGSYKYSKNDALDCQIVEIPYSGNQASFVIFLPNTKDGLPLLLYKLKLAPEMMQTGMQNMNNENLILSIPKFKTATTIDLKDAYEKLGLVDILKTPSGLNGIVKGQDLYVSKAVQKAIIDVNENGTTAAAASMVMVLASAALGIIDRIIFNADRPFLYLIKVKKEIMFLGAYVD